MYPKLLNSSNQTLAFLDNITSSKVKEVINGAYTFAFSAIEKELKSEFFVDGNKIEVDGQQFDIVAIDKDHKQSLLYDVECEHVAYRLLKDEYLVAPFTMTDTPANIGAHVLSGTEFSMGDVDFPSVITFNTTESAHPRTLIKNLAALLGGEIQYRDGGFTIDILNEIGQNNGGAVIFGKNLLGITSHWDKRESSEISYTVDIAMLAGTTEYKKLGLSSLETYNLGDSILIKDSVANIETTQRILSRTYDPIKNVNQSVELVSEIVLITDTIQDIKYTTGANTASITALDGEIELLTEDVDGNTAAILIESDRIDLNVSAISGNAAAITVLSDEIDLKVDADGIISSINVSPEAIKIASSRIELAGDVVVTSDLVDGQTTISGNNIKTGVIDAIEYRTGYNNGVRIVIGDSASEDAIDWRTSSGTTMAYVAAADDGELRLIGVNDVNIQAIRDDVRVSANDDIRLSADLVDINADADISGGLEVDDYIRWDGNSVVTSSGSSQRIQIQYFSDHIEVRNGTSGSWDVIAFD